MIYLDNAATSYPKPEIVKKSAYRAMSLCANPGRSGHEPALTSANVLLECRSRLCKFFNCDNEMNFIFTLNCTDSLNMAIRGILNKGDHVVTTSLEHNSVLRPLHTLSQADYISYSVVLPDVNGVIQPEDIESSINYATKLVVVTHASNVTGDVQPVEEIIRVCHENNVYVLVDGAQAVGKIKVDLKALGADMYAFPGHKGLLGTMGSGVLYVGENVPLASFRQGGTGSSSMCLSQPNEMPERLESGTPSVDSIAALAAGVYLCNKNFNEYSNHTNKLAHMLKAGLSQIRGIQIYTHDTRTGVVSFNVLDVPSYVVADYLGENDVACRAGYHCAPLCHRYLNTVERGAVRFSVGPFNTEKEIKQTVKVVKSFVDKL